MKERVVLLWDNDIAENRYVIEFNSAEKWSLIAGRTISYIDTLRAAGMRNRIHVGHQEEIAPGEWADTDTHIFAPVSGGTVGRITPVVED